MALNSSKYKKIQPFGLGEFILTHDLLNLRDLSDQIQLGAK